MPARFKIAEAEEPDLFGIRLPSKGLTGFTALALIEAADLAHLIPDGRAAGSALAVAAAGVFLKGIIRRRR
ncbi:hypothetical protein OG981_53735 [Streptomyces mirabilis]|uniref:hypothetical protein n=1 Tax=Streptomyces mirabilis TaxID=68239 RepID=UPI002E209BA6